MEAYKLPMDRIMSEEKKLNRGGQPGNRNARKHGFYSKVLDETQKRDLKAVCDVKGLDEEISLLRVKLKSVLEHDPENIRLIIQAVSALARLLRARNQLAKGKGFDSERWEKALETVYRDFAQPLGMTAEQFFHRDSWGKKNP